MSVVVSPTLVGLTLALLLLLPQLAIRARAETFTAPPLGPPSVPITGTWQFHTGDDLAWANPGFDDSGWQPLQADQPWGAQGHPGYRGLAWYRKRINLGDTSSPLGLYVPAADGAYEVYWNSQKIGSSGSLPPNAVWWSYGKDAVFPLGTGATSGVLAFRIWAAPASTNTARQAVSTRRPGWSTSPYCSSSYSSPAITGNTRTFPRSALLRSSAQRAY